MEAAGEHFAGRAKMGDDSVDEMLARFERDERREGKRPSSRVPRKKKPPPELEYLITWYDHCRAGQARGMEVEPLSHQEIVAFAIGHQIVLESFETTILRQLDGPWFENLPKKEREQEQPRPPFGRR